MLDSVALWFLVINWKMKIYQITTGYVPEIYSHFYFKFSIIFPPNFERVETVVMKERPKPSRDSGHRSVISQRAPQSPERLPWNRPAFFIYTELPWNPNSGVLCESRATYVHKNYYIHFSLVPTPKMIAVYCIKVEKFCIQGRSHWNMIPREKRLDLGWKQVAESHH